MVCPVPGRQTAVSYVECRAVTVLAGLWHYCLLQSPYSVFYLTGPVAMCHRHNVYNCFPLA